ncbi:MAG TPA: hypothetical protein VIP46_02720 [Pyrinomonadaceae bacterium]
MKRRLKVFFVSDDVIVLLLTGRARILGLPEGCTMERAFYHYSKRGFGIIVEHDSFEPVEPGCEPPYFSPEIEMVN